MFRRILNKELTDQHLEQLLSSGSTKLIKGFKGKKGVSFDAAVTFDENYNPVFSFPKPKNGKANSTVIPIHGQRKRTALFHLQGRAFQVSGKIILTVPAPVFSPKILPVEAVRSPAPEIGNDMFHLYNNVRS